MISIIEEIGGDVFGLLVDESADVSGKEQMAVVLRYVDKSLSLCSLIYTISELAKLMVSTNKHMGFPLVYRLLKLVLVLPVATISVERCFSAMKIVKTITTKSHWRWIYE